MDNNTKICDTCRHFYTCDNVGTYEECMVNGYSEYEVDLYKCEDLEYVCNAALVGNLTEEDVKSLLLRDDVDRDYNDMYFRPMLPVSSIRDALEQNENAKNFI